MVRMDSTADLENEIVGANTRPEVAGSLLLCTASVSPAWTREGALQRTKDPTFALPLVNLRGCREGLSGG